MTLDDYFHLVKQVMKAKAIYSDTRKAWVISRLQTQFILLEHIDCIARPLMSAPELLTEGIRRGFWKTEADKEQRTRIVVLK